MNYEITQYQDSDYEAVWALHKKTVTENPEGFVQNLDFHEDIHAINKKYQAFWVVRYDDKIIAMVGLKELGEGAVELKRMEVDSDYQGKGIGKRLLENFITYCASQGYKEIILDSSISQKASHKLYQSFGFEITHEENCSFGPDRQEFKMLFMKKVL